MDVVNLVEQATPAVILAAILSVVMEWFPKLRDKWEELNENRKRGLMALGVAIITLITLGYNCYGRGECPADWTATVMSVLWVALMAAASNQLTHSLNPYRPATPTRNRAYSK